MIVRRRIGCGSPSAGIITEGGVIWRLDRPGSCVRLHSGVKTAKGGWADGAAAQLARCRRNSKFKLAGYLIAQRGTFVPLLAGFTCFLLVGYAQASWLAVILIRNAHMAPGKVGFQARDTYSFSRPYAV